MHRNKQSVFFYYFFFGQIRIRNCSNPARVIESRFCIRSLPAYAYIDTIQHNRFISFGQISSWSMFVNQPWWNKNKERIRSIQIRLRARRSMHYLSNRVGIHQSKPCVFLHTNQGFQRNILHGVPANLHDYYISNVYILLYFCMFW